MSEYSTPMLISKLKDKIKHKQREIEKTQKEIEEIQKEIEVLRLNKCSHFNVEKIHSSSGASVLQSVICKDCRITLAQKWGYGLFDINKADKIHRIGN